MNKLVNSSAASLLMIILVGCEESTGLLPFDDLESERDQQDVIANERDLTVHNPSKSLEQAYTNGRDEAKYVFEMFFYKSGMCLNTTLTLNENTWISHIDLGHIKCWVPYDQNNGHESFVEFCQDYEDHMIDVACSAPTCDLRAHNLTVLKGFNEYMMLNPALSQHGYIGQLDPSCNGPC